MASICCSPPLSDPASWPARSAQAREERMHPGERLVHGRAAPRAGTRRGRGCRARSGPGRCAAPPARWRRPCGRRGGRAGRRHRSRRSGPSPRAMGSMPAIACTSVVLPAPFGPTMQTTSPSATSRSTSHERLGLAVEDVEPAHLKHGRRPPCAARQGRPRIDGRVAHDGGRLALGEDHGPGRARRCASPAGSPRAAGARPGRSRSPTAWMRRTTPTALSTSPG